MSQLQKTPMRAVLFVSAVLLVLAATIEKPEVSLVELWAYIGWIGIAAYFTFVPDKGGEK